MQKTMHPKVLRTKDIFSDRVRNAAGDNLGKIEELAIDVNTGRVAYAVLSFGGILKMGNKLFAIPWEALNLDTQNKEFVLNVDKTRLENATGFDKDNWPDMADPRFGTTIYKHYGYKPYWEDVA
jgi:sporulation protein YlmC with PRC-barrel domain